MPKKFLVEKDVKDAIKDLFKRYDVWYFMPSMNGYGRQGIPDFIACVEGSFLAVEAKFGDRPPTAHQKRELKDISVVGGGVALVVNQHNLDTLEETIVCLRQEVLGE